MAVRALIIAIEDYKKVQDGGIAKTLPGTLQAGQDFKAWLLAKWKAEKRAEADTHLIFCSEPAQPGGSGAARDDILGALLELRKVGRGSTEELTFYFSGHGFSFAERIGARADIVITSDFAHRDLSSQCCLKLDEIVLWLCNHLGPGRHYYFVDACRNKLDASQITVGALPPTDANASADASIYVLQSTMDGATARVGSAFPKALLAGLSGKGRAKAWQPQIADSMVVRYDTLRSFLKSTLTSQPITSRTEGPEGESDAVLATISPVPQSTLTVEIANAAASVKGEIAYTRGRAGAPVRQAFDSQPIVLPLEPDDYAVSLRLQDGTVDPAAAVPVDLYDDRSTRFTSIAGGISPPPPMPPPPPPMGAAVDIVVPPRAVLDVRNMSSGDKQTFDASETAQLPQGRYLATLRGGDGGAQFLKRKEIIVEAGADIALNLADWHASMPHVAIADRLPQAGGGVWFSESLGGPVTDPDLDLWLALLAAGRVLGSRGDFSKLAPFPLHDFIAEPPGASPIYLLAGFEGDATRLAVGLSSGADVPWTWARHPPAMPGIREAYLAAHAGPQLLSVRIGDGAPYTIATLAVPNRAMVVTLTLDEEGGRRFSQYLLPLGHLMDFLQPEVRKQLADRTPLADVRFLAQASRAFRRRRSIEQQVPSGMLLDLLLAKWLDPIGCALAAYEYVRRGRLGEIGEAVANMMRFFAELPDTSALARLNGNAIARPRGVPLFFDGLRAFPDYAAWLPLPASHLDFASPWTAWLAAVKI
jgi:hypothetical protein